MKWLVGIDEAGRGPLAGPVAVGVAVVPVLFDWTLLSGVNDSKKLKESKREEVYRRALELKRAGKLDFAVCQTSALVIDKIGIVGAVETAMSKALKRLQLREHDCEVRLDGALKAPITYANQKTIIGGDGLEPIIGLASILAKVTRDRYMTRAGNKPELLNYNLAVHKGYGTKEHRELISLHGLSDIHRRSFCKNIQT